MKATRDSASSIFRWVTTSSFFFLFCAGAFAQVSREEALARIYPGAAIRAERVFLTQDQKKRAAAVSGLDIPSSLVARYSAEIGGRIVGRAYVDTHTIRTKNESLLICLDQTGKIRRIEVTAFLEPPEYKATDAWYGQFRDKALTDDLNLNRSIRPIAGATLTATATTRAARRVLAINQVLSGGER